MYPSPLVGHRTLGVIAHATGAGLVLTTAEPRQVGRAPDLGGTTGLEPRLGAATQEVGTAQALPMNRAAEPRHAHAKTIGHLGIKGNPCRGRGDLLDRPVDLEGAAVVVTHIGLVGRAPAG